MTVTQSERTRILIVDDHELIRDGLRLVLSNEVDLEVCGEAIDQPAAQQEIRNCEPDIAIVDLSLGTGDGMDLVRYLRQHHPNVKVLVLSMHDEKLYGERALRAGASGFINKRAPARDIVSAIRRIRGGGVAFTEELTGRLLRRSSKKVTAEKSALSELSDRELSVFRMLGSGLTTDEIAANLYLSRSTVDTYRQRLKAKLGLHNGSDLVYTAMNWVHWGHEPGDTPAGPEVTPPPSAE